MGVYLRNVKAFQILSWFWEKYHDRAFMWSVLGTQIEDTWK